MKKIVLIVFVLLIIGYIAYQNSTLLLLRIMTLFTGSSSSTITSSGSLSPKPPFKDGTYIGNPEDAFYGNIQVQTVISAGKIVDVQFLQYPGDRTRSLAINTLAMPNLKQEAIQAQSANVDIISGATDSSNAFVQSLSSALAKSK